MSENASVKHGVAAVGVLQLLQGIAAVAENEMFVVGIEYIYKSTSPPGDGYTSCSGR